MRLQPLHAILASAALTLSLPSLATAQPPQPPITLPTAPISADPDLTTKIDAALAAPNLRHATVGIVIQSLKTGAVLYEHNGDQSLNPASCEKLLTGSTILARLGPDYAYHTTLYRTGTIGADGTLTGDLYLRGTGDPSFKSADLTTLGKALYAQGVRHFNGRLFADATRFDEAQWGLGWEWEDLFSSDCAEISALNCDGNTATVSVAPAAATGSPPAVAFDGTPLTSDINALDGTWFLRLRNDAQTGAGRGGKVRIDHELTGNEILVRGTIAPGSDPTTEDITIDEPALFTVFRLRSLLPACGIDIAPGAGAFGKAAVPTNAVVIAEKVSDPLSKLLTHCWKVSDNHYAEVFLKTVGAERGQGGTSRSGAGVVSAFLQESGVDATAVTQVDGSGLSRRDIVSPRALVGLLAAMDKQPQPVHDVFLAALPVAGVDGTLRNRMKGTPAQGHVFAKTGSLTAVSALSGFATAQSSGERFAFSVLVNNNSNGAAVAHALQDFVAETLCNR